MNGRRTAKDAPHGLNNTAASLLGFLHERPMTGWDLVAAAEQLMGDFWSITRSQVYRELSTMARAGLVEEGERGKRDRRPYAITEAGRTAFADWSAAMPGEEAVRFPLLLMLTLGRHIPRDHLTAAVEHHRALHAERLAEYEGQAEGMSDPYAAATLSFGIHYERAVLAWFDDLPEEITGGPRKG
ncbi:PadR family transcriptional regulator [Nocardiopsis baichengensis]|uniref:PadR family transcriptional regulator n=1 Tax=Nocardiopsis baichengensis TaxID=280240 RepID=UPI00034CFAB2|nr:PadR family transcriptional regulator [Nocardiopsis baichengensis]